jgi:aminopeptidase-like protein
MKERRKKFEEISPGEFLLLREKLGIGRYRKTRKRDEEERKILLEIGLKKMKEKEEDDFIPIGYRTRRVKIFKK